MKAWFAWSVVFVISIAGPASVRGETAQQAFANGRALLAKADFQGAMQAFATAARADRTSQEYLQHYALVRRVITLRQNLDSEQDDAQWEYIARGLHSFYVTQGLYREALELDRRIHARLNTASSAVMLAETQLALKMNADAAQTLAGLSPAKQTAATRALHGLALARQGRAEAARQVAENIHLAADAGPGTIYSVARLNAAVGNEQQTLALLTRCFESVAPTRLPAFKDHARQSPEFAGLVSTAAFVKVLQTQSKVPESKCSGGSGCASCPMRGKCAGSQGH